MTSRSIMDMVLSHLPADGSPMSRDELHASIELWAPVTIKHALRALREEGSVIREGSHEQPIYRLAENVSREKRVARTA